MLSLILTDWGRRATSTSSVDVFNHHRPPQNREDAAKPSAPAREINLKACKVIIGQKLSWEWKQKPRPVLVTVQDTTITGAHEPQELQLRYSFTLQQKIVLIGVMQCYRLVGKLWEKVECCWGLQTLESDIIFRAASNQQWDYMCREY